MSFWPANFQRCLMPLKKIIVFFWDKQESVNVLQAFFFLSSLLQKLWAYETVKLNLQQLYSCPRHSLLFSYSKQFIFWTLHRNGWKTLQEFLFFCELLLIGVETEMQCNFLRSFSRSQTCIWSISDGQESPRSTHVTVERREGYRVILFKS